MPAARSLRFHLKAQLNNSTEVSLSNMRTGAQLVFPAKVIFLQIKVPFE